MAYSGFLIKVGNYEIPTDKYIKTGSYVPYVNMQALDPYTDADGYEHIGKRLISGWIPSIHRFSYNDW